ncbi:MAG: heavy-metal-associated domain-containing protein [Clostridia bacterium]|nr:heavy-metal-associated domain-containing protein [Clostridia bacterium]
MKDFIVILILAVVLIFALSGARKRLKGGCCGSGGSKPKKVKPKNSNTADYAYKVTAYIEGMTCDGCKVRVENAFNSLADCYAKVNLKNKSAEIWTNTKMSEDEIADIIKKNGYTLVKCSQE